MNETQCPLESDQVPFRRKLAVAEIKLLRLSLVNPLRQPIDGIGSDWVTAQPSENLSPATAAGALGIRSWSRSSQVRQSYQKRMLRFPPEQFPAQHADWRPAAELLGEAANRLNWYWQSGQTPGAEIAEDLPQDLRDWALRRLNGALDLVCDNLGSAQNRTD